jgi:predicted dehydrogenase
VLSYHFGWHPSDFSSPAVTPVTHHKKAMNILHVGLGTRGRQWLEIVRDHRGVASAGCVDSELSALEWAKGHFPRLSNACYARVEDALNNTKADAAIIASPPAFRAVHAVAALEAGLAVMIEAPFASSLGEAAQVLEVSRRLGRPVVVAQNHRYARCARTLQALVRNGTVGTVTHVSCIDRRSRRVRNDDLATAAYPQLLDKGAHHFDSLRSILGVNPVTVMASCSKEPWSEYQHGSTTEAALEMESNIHVQYHGSLTANRDEHLLWIDGDKGVVRTNGSHVWWRKRGWPFFVPIRSRRVPAGDSLESQRAGTATLLDQLKAALLERRPPETSGEDNVWSLSMVEAAILSDKTGKLIHVGELLSAAGVAGLTSAAGRPGPC